MAKLTNNSRIIIGVVILIAIGFGIYAVYYSYQVPKPSPFIKSIQNTLDDLVHQDDSTSGDEDNNIIRKLEEDQKIDREIINELKKGNVVNIVIYLENGEFFFRDNVTSKELQTILVNNNIERIISTKVSASIDSAASVTGANIIREFGLKGNGQTICILDTGVDYTHPALGGCTETQFLNGL